MQCFICVTYLMILCSAYPPKSREKILEKRSLFRDVIESLRIRAQLPEDISPNEENNLSHNYERYGFENEPLQLPSDSEYLPRRNDRIEMPTLKYRFPKSIDISANKTGEFPSKEIVLYVDTPSDVPKTSTVKPKKQKRPRPSVNRKQNNTKENDDTEDSESNVDSNIPSNNLAGQSQIGNRETQTVVKPTVIVNFRGTITHRESEIRLERRNNNETKVDVPQNVFNIKQEIKMERADWGLGSKERKQAPSVKQDVKLRTENEKPKIEEDMMMCESKSLKDKNERLGKKYDILQILFTI